MEDRIRIRSEEVLSDDWALLKKTVYDYRRRDGGWETQIRQTYDRGDGAVILPFDPERGTVLLVRQFRFPAYVTGHKEPLIEACAGLLDADDPETCIRKEAEEELGYRLRDVRHLFTPYMSPGSVTERLSFFVADYTPADRISEGGGAADEGLIFGCGRRYLNLDTPQCGLQSCPAPLPVTAKRTWRNWYTQQT